MPDPTVHHFFGLDGTNLVWREMGEGRPLVLLHGFSSSAMVNWVCYGHAFRIAACGIRVIMPDLRGHGDSSKPHNAIAYPHDVLADDGFALIEQLDLREYDLGGYSLGALTVVRMLKRGARPGKAIVAGMGLEGILMAGGRNDFFRRVLTNPGTFARGSQEWMTEAFLKTVGGDPMALLRILDTSINSTREEISRIEIPTLVVSGADDEINASARSLAAVLPNSRFVEVPGNHMSAVTRPEFGAAIADFVGGDERGNPFFPRQTESS